MTTGKIALVVCSLNSYVHQRHGQLQYKEVNYEKLWLVSFANWLFDLGTCTVTCCLYQIQNISFNFYVIVDSCQSDTCIYLQRD